MSDYIIYIYPVLIGLTLFYLFSQGFNRKKYNVQDLFAEDLHLESERKKENRIQKNKIIKWLIADDFVNEANRYNWRLKAKEYWMYVLCGGAGITLVLSIFNLGFISNVGFVGGFFLPRILLSAHKFKYKRIIEDSIIIYMKSVANAMKVYGSAVDAIESVLPLLQSPIKDEVESALSVLRSGETVSTAFQKMDERYRYSDLIFFHNMLGAAHENGGEFHEILGQTADEFEHKKILQAKLKAVMAQGKRSFYQNVLLVIGMILAFKFFARDLYNSFYTLPVGKGVLIFIFITIVIASIRVNKHCQFNPDDAK